MKVLVEIVDPHTESTSAVLDTESDYAQYVDTECDCYGAGSVEALFTGRHLSNAVYHLAQGSCDAYRFAVGPVLYSVSVHSAQGKHVAALSAPVAGVAL